MMKNDSKSLNKYTFLIILSFVFLAYRFLARNPDLRIAYAGLFFCSILSIFFLLIERQLKVRSVLAIICFDLIAILALIYNHNRGISEIAILISFQSIGITLYIKKETFLAVSIFSILYYAYIAFCIIARHDPNTIFSSTSRNYVSVFSLFFLALYVFRKNFSGQKIKIWYFLLNLLVCLWAHGRGGILASVIAIMGFILLDSDFSRLDKKIRVGFFIILTIGIIFIYKDFLAEKIFYEMEKEGRIGLWSRYFS